MFSRIRTKKSMSDFSALISQLETAIKNADAVMIGAGAGLSTSAGFVYNGERFEMHFADFEQKYGFRDMYSGGFYTPGGDYGLFQCSVPCCQEIFDNEKMVIDMVNAEINMRIPSELLPICPHCGKPMTMNLRSDNRFVEEEGWHLAAERYETFLQRIKNRKVLFLELGTGYNTPGIIKYPFWKMAYLFSSFQL